MYKNTSTEFNNIIAEAGRTFKARLIHGADIISDIHSMTLTQAVNSTDDISIGGGIAAYIEASIANTDIQLENVEYEMQIGLRLSSGEYEYVPMGFYTPQKPSIGAEVTKFTAYGRLYSKLSGTYESSLDTYPIDGKRILEEIQQLSGVPIDISDLPDGVMVNQRVIMEDNGVDEDGNDIRLITYEKPFAGYSYREALCYLAQMYGRCAVEDRAGNIKFKWYTKSDQSFTKSQYKKEIEQAEAEFVLGTIQCTTNEETLISGGGSTGIAISNPLMLQETLDKVYQWIGGFKCRGMTAEVLGNICIDVMDVISIQIGDTYVDAPVMKLVTTFDGGISQNVSVFGNANALTESKGPTAQRIDRVYKDLLLIREVIAQKISADNLFAKVAQVGFLTAEEFNVASEKIEESLTQIKKQLNNELEAYIGDPRPTATNYPANEWTEEQKTQNVGTKYYCSDSTSWQWMYDELSHSDCAISHSGNTLTHYYWMQLSDSTVGEALANANDALKQIGDLSTKLIRDYYTKTETDASFKATNEGIESLAKRTTTAEANIESIDGRFANYVDTKTYESGLEQTAEGFKQYAENNYTTKTEFGNMKIGGENLILNSLNFMGLSHFIYSYKLAHNSVQLTHKSINLVH